MKISMLVVALVCLTACSANVVEVPAPVSSSAAGGDGSGGAGEGGAGGSDVQCTPFTPPGAASYCVAQGHPDKPYAYQCTGGSPPADHCVMVVAAAVIWCCDTEMP